MGKRVAIVGGGFSGAMLAARLAETGVASTLVDRTGTFGPGLAYATPFDGHVLNVRSGRMSAVEGRSDDFLDWLKVRHPDHADPEGFAPRPIYGEYLRDRLTMVEATHPGLIELVTGCAAAIEDASVLLDDGRRIEAGSIVLATGNPKPRTAVAGGHADGRRVIGDPWKPGVLKRIGASDNIVILGAGLTMVDVVLWLKAHGWRGRAVALSRRGLKPKAHGAKHDAAVPPGPGLTTGPLSHRLAQARRLSREGGWRGVMEGLRAVTAALWIEADPATRGRFLRHLRPWWDAHRHRIAGSVAAALDQIEGEGRLRVIAGRVNRIDEDDAGVSVAWLPRHGDEASPLKGQWLIDCTGPGHDPAEDPLTGRMIASGRARSDSLALGLDLDPAGRVLRRDGSADGRLFVLGPPARAAFWETTAVPDIRKRIEQMVPMLREATA